MVKPLSWKDETLAWSEGEGGRTTLPFYRANKRSGGY
jgi:hypothetical protein